MAYGSSASSASSASSLADLGYFAPPSGSKPTVPPPPGPPRGLSADLSADLPPSPSLLPPSPPPPPGLQRDPAARPGHYPVGERLSFLERVGSGIDLARTCWGVLRGEPQLLLVPLATLLASAAVIVPLLLLVGGPADPQAHRVLAGVQTFAVGVVCAVIGNLGTAVVVSAATARLQGLRPEIGKCWQAALAKLPQLAALGLVMAAERALTGLLRDGPFGRLLAGFIDRAWDFASLMSIPVIVFEDAGPFQSVRRSAELVKSRWGSQLAARSVLAIGVFCCALPLLVVMVLLGALWSPLLALVMFGGWLLLVVSVTSALHGILSAAMYRYAITGLVVPGFREADLWRAFSRASPN